MNPQVSKTVVPAVMRYRFARPELAQKTDRFVSPRTTFSYRDLSRLEVRFVLASDTNSDGESAIGGSVEIRQLLCNNRRRIQGQQERRRSDHRRSRLLDQTRQPDNRLG
jgi:hypothetical protein